MRRRTFLGTIGGAAVWPLVARAQTPSMPVVGFLGNWPAGSELTIDGFRRGLKEMGFVEGQNVVIDYRWAEGRPEHHAEFAADLVRRRVAVIFSGNNVGALAAKAATSEIPIVFAFGLDPVRMGLVSSINRPGGNATGVSIQVSALEPKRCELLRNILPSASMVGAMVNPDNPNAENHGKDLEEAASAFGLKTTFPRDPKHRRHRRGVRDARSAARRGAARYFRSLIQQSAPSACRLGRAQFDPRDVPVA